VNVRALQFFFGIFWCLASIVADGALSIGPIYSLSFTDIDGNKLSTADGHVTVLVAAIPADREKPRALGDRVPDRCLGNPDYRMITIVRFAKNHTAIGRRIATAFVRHRINDAAKRLQARYSAQKIVRDARNDIFVVPDFDGTASSQLPGKVQGTEFRVLVFARDGKLLAQWTDVPSAKQLDEVLK
jgi:hypothetical protein